MSEFYKMEPLRWDRGTDNLTLEQEAAYLRVCNAIYAADQPIAANHQALAGMWRCNVRKAKRLLSELIDAGKIYVEDGWIKNERVLIDVMKRRELRNERQSSGKSGGIESGKSRAKALKTQETSEANGSTRKEVEVEVEAEEKRDGKPSLAHPPVGEGAAEVVSHPTKPNPKQQPVGRFAEFWQAYPHRGGLKKGRAPAEKSFAKAVKRGVPEAAIIAGAKAAHSHPDVVRGYARDPATWLNQEGWRDEFGSSRGSGSSGGYWTSMGYIPEAVQ